MGQVLPAGLLETTRMSKPEFLLEVAVMLYQREKLTVAQAARLSGLGRLEFQQVLASRGLSVNYDVQDFEEDLKTLGELGLA